MRLRHKYNAKRTTRNGLKFPSKKEAKRYDELVLLQKAGEVVFFLRQTSFDFPGGVKYRCDFQIFWADGTITFEDVKGKRTDEFIRNKKQVEALYPIEIIET